MTYYVDGRPDIGGRETDARARKYQQEHSVSYEKALGSVVRGEQVKQQRRYAESSDERMAGQRLGAMVANLPKKDDGSVDLNLALEVINGHEDFRALAQEAAGQYLDNLAKRLLGTAHPHENVTYEDAFRVVARDNGAVNKVYLGNRVTAEGLKQICWTLFRYQQSSERTALNELYYPGWKSERPSVRRYSSGNVYFDENGHEVHKYSFDVCRR